MPAVTMSDLAAWASREALPLDDQLHGANEEVSMLEILAVDQASLRHEPVTARPPSLADRVTKLALRYRLAAALVLLTAAAITLAAIFSSFALIRTRRAEAEARSEAAAARQAIDFLVGLFEAAKPESGQGEEVSAKTLVALGAEKTGSRPSRHCDDSRQPGGGPLHESEKPVPAHRPRRAADEIEQAVPGGVPDQ